MDTRSAPPPAAASAAAMLASDRAWPQNRVSVPETGPGQTGGGGGLFSAAGGGGLFRAAGGGGLFRAAGGGGLALGAPHVVGTR